MNSMQIKDKLKNISRSKNINFNLLLRNYMYERFIERLAVSKYKDNFILKGGYYLSTLFGVQSRSTMDIDLSLKNETLSFDNIKNIVNEIISINLKDNAVILFEDITTIRDDDEYGGYRVKLTVKIESIRETFNVDIATGDPITPKEIIFKYKALLDYKYINLKSYNLETVLAEKLEAILSKKDLSSRAKDYYDIYLIYNIGLNKINVDNLRKAVDKTFKKREFNDDIAESLNLIKDSDILRIRWKAYSRKYKYAQDISYDEIMECLSNVIAVLDPVEV